MGNKPNRSKQNIFIGTATDPRKVTPKMVKERAEALAQLKGRYPRDVTEADLAQARRELTSKTDAKA